MAARLEKDIFVRTHLHTVRIVVRIATYAFFQPQLHSIEISKPQP